MKMIKILSVLGLVSFLSACGSSGNNAATTLNPYGQASCIGNNCYTQPTSGTLPGGGTYTKTVVLGNSPITTTNSYAFPGTVAVSAGDVVSVTASGGVAIHSGIQILGLPSTGQSYLTNLSVSVNGSQIGQAQFGYSYYPQQIVVPASGSLSFGADWQTFNSSGTHTVSLNGVVYLVHCLSPAGAAMSCPMGFNF